MNLIRNFSIRVKLVLLTSFLLLLMLISSMFSRQTLNHVKVLGPVYSEIASGKDLVADILPPPAYIIEAYLTSHALADTEDVGEAEGLLKTLESHQKIYSERIEHWAAVLPEGELRDALLGDARSTASEWFQIVGQKLVPQIRERRLEDARSLVNGELKRLYEQHREAIAEVVTFAEANNRDLEQSARATLESAARWTNGTAVAVCVILSLVIWLTSRNATRRLQATRQLARALASGDFSQRLLSSGGDEIDQMGAELSHASEKLDSSLSAMIRSMESAAGQDYSQVLTLEVPGELNRARTALNAMLGTLTELNEQNLEYKQSTRELLNRVSSAIMVVNTDFIVQYVNKGTMDLFARHAESFRKLWPDFNPENIVGTCIDRFHKVPAHQRQLLADPRNLPLKTDITVGNAKIQLHVTAVNDRNGTLTGYSLEWSDVTALRDSTGQLAAIYKQQAVIEFNLDGTILNANENFLRTTGYTLEEIRGRHHRMFVDPVHAASAEYQQFWKSLSEGNFASGEFRRIGKGGTEIWLQASYNPICDLNGRPFKIVKYAVDIRLSKQMEREIASRHQEDTKAAEELSAKVAQVLKVVNSVAEGSFDLVVPDLGDDAVGQVGKALSTAITSMRTALQSVQSVTTTVTSAATQVSSASAEISRGAQSQASSLEETASSLEEITSTVKQNTDNAQQARQLANGSRDIAEKGGAVVSDAIRAMGEINQSSTRIADIITTIDEIAFQTNLLALNAAVEAARAGEQGRGFAVVAAEVRNLAQRSALAAKEIKALIQDSVRKVENGTSLVNQSGRTLDEIVVSVKRVTDIVAEIAAASREQLTGLEQVNKAVAQMDRVTQSNASQTEEMAGTAESLMSHSEQLRDLISQFRLDSVRAESTARTSRPAETSRKRSLETNLDKVTSQLHQMSGAAAGFVEF